jgi:hypothetical protein
MIDYRCFYSLNLAVFRRFTFIRTGTWEVTVDPEKPNWVELGAIGKKRSFVYSTVTKTNSFIEKLWGFK